MPAGAVALVEELTARLCDLTMAFACQHAVRAGEPVPDTPGVSACVVRVLGANEQSVVNEWMSAVRDQFDPRPLLIKQAMRYGEQVYEMYKEENGNG